MVFKFYNEYKTRIIDESYQNLNLPIMVYLGISTPKKHLEGEGSNLNYTQDQMAQQMECLNGQTLQTLQQDRLVIGLDANFTNLPLCNLDV
jgi:hypothetical protein